MPHGTKLMLSSWTLCCCVDCYNIELGCLGNRNPLHRVLFEHLKKKSKLREKKPRSESSINAISAISITKTNTRRSRAVDFPFGDTTNKSSASRILNNMTTRFPKKFMKELPDGRLKKKKGRIERSFVHLVVPCGKSWINIYTASVKNHVLNKCSFRAGLFVIFHKKVEVLVLHIFVL